MQKYLSKFGKLEERHYRVIILFQLAVILVLLSTIFSLSPSKSVQSETSAQESMLLENTKYDVSVCLSLPQEQRSGCAMLIGKKIASQTQDPKEKITACQVFRPHYYIYDCWEGLEE